MKHLPFLYSSHERVTFARDTVFVAEIGVIANIADGINHHDYV
jgi:hypothetical protein